MRFIFYLLSYLLIIFSGRLIFLKKNIKLKNKILAEDLIKQLNSGQNVYYEDTLIEGDLDFTTVKDTVREGSNTYISYVGSHISFINCEFAGKIIAHNHSYDNTRYNLTFERNVSFEGSTFMNETNFERVRFLGKTVFRSVTFMDEAIFGKAQFIGKSTFRMTVFRNYADFVYTQFNNVADFRKVKFLDEADFGFSQFINYVDFENTVFKQNVIMRSQFIGEVSFHNAVFESKALMSASFLNGIYLKNTYFKDDADFEGSDFYNYANFNDSTFNNGANFDASIFFTLLISFENTDVLMKSSFRGTTILGKPFEPNLYM